MDYRENGQCGESGYPSNVTVCAASIAENEPSLKGFVNGKGGRWDIIQPPW